MSRLFRILVVVLLVLGTALYYHRWHRPPPHPTTSPPPPVAALMGTAIVADVFYSGGGAVAEFVNRRSEEHGVRLFVEPTGGSVYNIKAVMAGDLDFALAQASTVDAAVHGTGPWRNLRPQRHLRSICSLFAGTLMVVAADDSGIRTLRDLENHDVSIGNPGSGTRANVADIFAFPGFEWTRNVRTHELYPTDAVQQLHAGKIDAFFFNSGHPAAAITRASLGPRKIRFIPITDVQAFLKVKTNYQEAFIPVSLYPNAVNEEDVRTIGVPTILITSSHVPEQTVYTVTREILDDLEGFKTRHPAFGDLSRAGMIHPAFAPFHKGALRYYHDADYLTGDEGGVDNAGVVTIGTGDVDSYIAGGAVARLLNTYRADHGLRVFTVGMEGLRDNVEAVVAGDVDFALGHAAGLQDAFRAEGIWKGAIPRRVLRSVCRLYGQTLLVAAGAETGIETPADLKGRRIGIGPAGTERHLAATHLLADLIGEEEEAALTLSPYGPEETLNRFDQGDLDAYVMLYGLPPYDAPDAPRETPEALYATERPFRLVPITPEDVPEPKRGLYETRTLRTRDREETPALGLGVSLFTSANTPPERVRQVTRQIFEHLQALRETHSFLGGLQAERLLGPLPVPVHRGANHYLETTRYTPAPMPVKPERQLTLGTGSIEHAFFTVGGALAQVITQRDVSPPLRASVRPTPDSTWNLNALQEGKVDLALAPAGRIHEALAGIGRWKGHPLKGIRSICTLYTAAGAFVASDACGARRLEAMQGMRVSLPVPEEAGTRDRAISLFSLRRFHRALEQGYMLDPEEPPITSAFSMYRGQSEAFPKPVIEGFFYTATHPSPLLTEAIAGRPSRILPITGMRRFLLRHPWYTVTVIPANLYPKSVGGDDVPTLGVPIALVTSDKANFVTIYQTTRALCENVDRLRTLHPALSGLSIEGMSRTVVAERHPGAEKYFNEAVARRRAAERQVGVFTLGTAGLRGVFHPVGGAIARIFNRRREEHNMRIYVESTAGSNANVHAIADGALDFALAQANVLDYAVDGEKEWKDRPDDSLRSICTLHTGVLVLVAGEETGIRELRDLAGKRVSVGNPGSGTYQNVDDLMQARGYEWMQAIDAQSLGMGQAIKAFRSGEIDAFFLNVGPGSQALDLAFERKGGARFISLGDIDAFLAEQPAYVDVRIPPRYHGKSRNTAPARTFGAPTVLFTDARVPEKAVYHLTREIFENLDMLRTMHVALEDLEAASMLRKVIAPLHEGAVRYYREADLLDKTDAPPADAPAPEKTPEGEPPSS